jgi:hypothetical protein
LSPLHYTLLAMGAFAACRPQAQPASGTLRASGAPVELEGKLFVTGAEPHTGVTLVRPDSKGVTLVGPLDSELRRLSGATVRVRGVEGAPAFPRGLYVDGYDVLLIDGKKPSVGTLSVFLGGLSLVGQDTLELTHVPEGLRGQEGAKVWIVGSRSGTKLEVESFGIIRDEGQ